ncbi:MAG: hypothetical protein LBR28_01675 [Bacteroidales bacterium]|jgi:cell division protein FtsQ|nr:hypothetical protein [Bacteroidales bacterium]
MKKFLITISIIAGVAILIFAANVTAQYIKVKEVILTLHYQSDDKMLTIEEINKDLIAHFGDFKGKKRKEISVKEIVKYLNALNFVYSSKAELGILGKLEINVVQSKPIAVLISKNKNHKYLSSDAKILQPVANVHQAKVIQINIPEIISKTVKDTTNNSLLVSVYKIASQIYNNNSLKERINSINIKSNIIKKEKFFTYTLIPYKENYTIKLGDTTNIINKLKRLEYLYKDTNISKEQWNKYSEISLIFHGQAVCTKR